MKSINLSLLSLFLLTFSTNWSMSVWLDDNGGYRNIVIGVNSKYKIQNCKEFRKKLETVSQVFSESLYKATSKKLHVASIDVVLPHSSFAKDCNATAIGGRHSWNAADIQLTSERNVYQQWSSEGSIGIGVQQPWGCGRPGDRILLEDSYLEELNQTSEGEDEKLKILGQSLVASWAKYRWGIYEETSLEKSENGCSFGEECNNTTREEANSIMRYILSENATFCTASSHDGLTRSQHNLACKGLSAIDVMKRHPDFRENFQTLAQKYLSSIKNDRSLHRRKKIVTPLPAELSPPVALRRRSRRTARTVESSTHTALKASKLSSFIGTLPPVSEEQLIHNDTQRGIKSSKMLKSDSPRSNFIESISLVNTTLSPVAWITPTAQSEPKVTWVKKGIDNKGDEYNLTSVNDSELLLMPTIRFVVPSQKAIVVALDLSTSAVAQASVEWLRGGLLRWMFGLGEGVNVGILAAYSNTSFPLSPGPLTSGPIEAQRIEEYLTLLPFQHEVDDDVYGGKYCLSCIIDETEKMFKNAGIPLESGVLVLTVCEPQLSSVHMRQLASSVMTIHTVTICPNAPLYIEKLASKEGNSWALSTASMDLGVTAEVQLGHLLTDITKDTLLAPSDLRLRTIHEEDKILRKDQVERIGAYRRLTGSIKVDKSDKTRLIILTTSIPAKVVELRVGSKKVSLHRDTTRRYWAMLETDSESIDYSFMFLSTSLEFPLSIATGVYERTEASGIEVKLRSNTKRYRPGNPSDPYLTVAAEITQDGNPIQNADVVLSVTYLSDQIPSTYSLMLLDNGSTEPDMRNGDGIYSRYLTWTPGTGRYIISVAVASTKDSSITYLESNEIRTKKTSPFSVKSSSLSLVVEMVPPGDFFPPSRITDLKVVALQNSLVNISWSAPGGDLDQGSAWRYQLKMYTEQAALTETRFDSSGIDVYCIQGEERAPTPAPALFGTLQHCVAAIPFVNLDWYFAMKATDGANNSGEISNIVSIFVQEKVTSAKPLGSSSEDHVAQTVIMSTIDTSGVTSEKGGSWRIYGIALVAAVGFVMLSIAVFSFVLCCRRRAKAAKESDRPIYKIYVNNAYIQEEDGEIKVIDKEKCLADKDHTQWVNSLDKYPLTSEVKENQADISCDTTDSNRMSPGKYPKAIRFGVLTNGSIMRELPSSSSSSSSRPSDEALPDDFKYKDLSSETTSNSTLDGGAPTVGDNLKVICRSCDDLRSVPSSYQPLGIPPLHHDSDDEGGFNPTYGHRRHLPGHFSSFRQVSATEGEGQYPFHSVSKATNVALPHGTVRSVKKRRRISFV